MTRSIIARQEQLGPFVAWRAHDDSLGADASPYGHGETEAEAVADLEWQLDERSDRMSDLIDRRGLVDMMERVLRNLDANADATESYRRGYRAALDEVKRAAKAKVAA